MVDRRGFHLVEHLPSTITGVLSPLRSKYPGSNLRLVAGRVNLRLTRPNRAARRTASSLPAGPIQPAPVSRLFPRN